MVFLSALSQCFSLRRRLFCENQPIFVCHLPIDFFYFEDFQEPFFGKIIGQKQQLSWPRCKGNQSFFVLIKELTNLKFFQRMPHSRATSYLIYIGQPSSSDV